MVQQFDSLQLAFERVDAVDAETVSATEIEATLAPSGRLGRFHKGPQCCTLSHLRAYRCFLETNESHAVIFEDDARLSPDTPHVLWTLGSLPQSIGILKLERFGPVHQRVLLDPGLPIGDGREIGRLRSKHTGSAGYLISREAAKLILSRTERIDVDIDHFLFNPSISPVFDALNFHQLTPALVTQDREAAGHSDVASRRKKAPIGHKLLRSVRELQLLPRQLVSVAAGATRLAQVGYR